MRTCTPIYTPQNFGGYAQGSVLFGGVPLWDADLAPKSGEPPELFNLFVGTVFTYDVRAYASLSGQTVTIRYAVVLSLFCW